MALLLLLAAACGEATATDEVGTTATTSISLGRVRVEVLPVSEPVSFDDGLGTLVPPPPGLTQPVTAADVAPQFVQFIDPTYEGVIEARFGLYSDSSKGTITGDSLTPMFDERPVWVLVARNTVVVPAGPLGMEDNAPSPDHDTVGVFDATTGELLVTIEQAAAHPA